MYKSLILVSAVCLMIIEARPSWQYLPAVPGYVPVYIRNGDTPLEEINPDLAEAFHVLPAGRSAGKHLDAAPETPEQSEQGAPETPEHSDQGAPETPEHSELADHHHDAPKPFEAIQSL